MKIKYLKMSNFYFENKKNFIGNKGYLNSKSRIYKRRYIAFKNNSTYKKIMKHLILYFE